MRSAFAPRAGESSSIFAQRRLRFRLGLFFRQFHSQNFLWHWYIRRPSLSNQLFWLFFTDTPCALASFRCWCGAHLSSIVRLFNFAILLRGWRFYEVVENFSVNILPVLNIYGILERWSSLSHWIFNERFSIDDHFAIFRDWNGFIKGGCIF